MSEVLTWHERINRAERMGSFNDADLVRAGSWITCACGELDPRIPRDARNRPLDVELRAYGHRFVEALIANSFADCRLLLGLIEHRAARLLTASGV